MKKIFHIIGLFVCFSTVFTACDKNETAPEYPTLDAFLQTQPNLSTFSQAIEKAQLQTFKTGLGPFTWYAPTNEAFAAAGIAIDQLTPGQLSYYMTYHLNTSGGNIPGEPITKKDMIAQNSYAKTSANGTSIYLGTSGDTAYVNGTPIISADNRISSGVVHIINRFNIPPNLRGNMQTILNSTGQHTLFLAALTRANRLTVTNSSSVYTILAPTDAAMTAAGFTTASITASTVGKMDTLVRYHIFSGPRLFTNDLIRTPSPSTFLGSTTILSTSNRGKQVKGRSNASPIDIIISDLLGTNGVVHVINGVLKY